jgi:hypothetical protein
VVVFVCACSAVPCFDCQKKGWCVIYQFLWKYVGRGEVC